MDREKKHFIIRILLFSCFGAMSIGSAFYISSVFVRATKAKNVVEAPPNPFLTKEILIAQNDIPAPPPPAPPQEAQPSADSSQQQPSTSPPVLPQANNASEDENKEEDYELFLEPYNYDPSGRRDPFVRIENIGFGGVGSEIARPLLPLERYDLNEIQLVGIIWSVKNPRAMFLDPEQKVHVLGKDERIGRNQGYIAVIREGEVVVVESTEKSGEVVYQTKVMRLLKENF